MRSWWRGIMAWPEHPWTSLAVIPLSSDPITSIPRLRKGLRDIRDRNARLDHRWAGVTFAGMLSEQVAMVLVNHRDLDQASVWWTLSARWPDAVIVDVGDAQPSWRMTATDAAALARRRRGIEPVRIVVMPQRIASMAQHEPMPIAFNGF